MDFPQKLKIQIIRTVTKLVEYEVSFTTGTVIDLLNQSGYWPEDVNKVNAYYRVKEIIQDTLINLDYDAYQEDMLTVYVPKRVKKEIEEMIEEQEKNLTVDDIIDMTVKNVPIDNKYEFKFPKFNRFWDKRWKKFY